MSLQFQNSKRFFELHGSTGLTDWDMDEEMKLTTTTDPFFQDGKLNYQYLAQWHPARISRRNYKYVHDQKSESVMKSNLWLMVNPNLACPIKSMRGSVHIPTADKVPVELQMPRHAAACPVHSEPCTSSAAAPSCHAQCVHASSSTTGSMDKESLKIGSWPRPPVSYRTLIAVALRSSRTGSLNLQQIYNFTREHFPFFQTAPDGWKSSIRHNLCLGYSFRRTTFQLCRDGKRKPGSSHWHLTVDGRRSLLDDIGTLTGESFQELKGSMSRPDVIHTLFAL